VEMAKQIYDEVLADKLHEGYAPETGTPPPYLMQTRKGRVAGFDFARAVQTELWGRNYGYSWGVRDEFAAVFNEHPDLLALPVKEAADKILGNLPAWSPALAIKEAKAKAAYVSPEKMKETDAMLEQLRRAIKTRVPIGAEDAKVFICDFDSEAAPKLKAGTWAVYSNDYFVGAFDSQEKAMTRAQELASRAVKFEVSLTNDEKSISLTISAKKVGPTAG
jgi:hypothetical protein